MNQDKKSEKTFLEKLSPLVRTLLHNRGITTDAAAKDFLNPDYKNFSDPFLLNDMQKTVDRILEALVAEERITIYADYDADGVPGAALLADFFNSIGYTNFSVYIPHRHHEGFGFHLEAVEKIAEEKTKLIITIDLGTASVGTVARANELGVDVVITDHHEAIHDLPEAIAIVNPKLGDYPDRMICGAATIFQVVRAVIQVLRGDRDTLDETLSKYVEVVKKWPDGHEKWWLDLVGISTIADMVPLVGENRILAKFGLLVARKSRRAGLHALSRQGFFPLHKLDEQDVGFNIAPRINSASRMEHAIEAFTLLSTPDRGVALEQAKLLARLNDRRKRVTATTVKQAGKLISERSIRDVIVLGHPDWNPGVLSILAGKLMEKHGRTTFVWTTHGTDKIKGSARAAEGQSVLKLMEGISEKFIKFGGHEAAGGFTCHRDSIHTMEDEFQKVFANLYEAMPEKKNISYTIDAEIQFAEIDRRLLKMINQLSPFGKGNPQPVFIFSNGVVHSIRQFGKHEEHIELIIKDSSGRPIKAVAFFKSIQSYGYTPMVGEEIRLVGNVTLNRFLGKEELRMSLIDIVKAQ